MDELATVELSSVDGCCVATVSGEIDISNADTIRRVLDAGIGDAHRLVLDLAATTYLDSVGVHLIFDLAGRLTVRRQELALVVPDDALISRVLGLADLPTHVKVHRDLAAALTG
jgi:anti-sigma B factor antagonist/stage II sporulation protein AA (anti-sigma F factor antagonist)